jgi:hypothetical protein
MRTARLGVLTLALALAGCGGEPKSDEIVPLEMVPPNVMEAARKQLPGITFGTIYKMKVDGKDAYDLHGKDKAGKTRGVEISATGEVLDVE